MMKNPTPQELMQYADGTLSDVRRLELEQLIAASPALQRELRLLRGIDAVVRRDERPLLGDAFTERILDLVLPTPSHPFRSFIEEYSSGLFAMTLVAGMVLIVLSATPSGNTGVLPSVVHSYSTAYDTALRTVSGPWMGMRQLFRQISVPSSARFLMLGMFMLGLAVAADGFIGRRLTHIRIDR